MNKLRHLSMAAGLALTLAVPVFAGITDTPPAPPPRPPDGITLTGIIDTPPAAPPANEPVEPVVNLLLTLLPGVLSAF